MRRLPNLVEKYPKLEGGNNLKNEYHFFFKCQIEM